MTVVVFDDLDVLLRSAPLPLGTTEWVSLDPDRVADFQRATWAGPLRDRLVPPFMLLSLTNLFLPDLLTVPAAARGVNYGTGTVRFGPLVPIDARLRGGAELVEASEVTGGVQTTVRIRVESEATAEPACVVDSLSRWMR